MSRRLSPIALKVLLAPWFVLGCSVPVATDLREGDANAIVVALEAERIAGDKQRDPEAQDRWLVSVGRADASSAIKVLAREELPTEPAPGLLQALGSGGLVPSRAAERARLIVGTTGELERSLSALDGVRSARVHLAVPAKTALSNASTPPASASVLLKYRGELAPLSNADIRALIAGAVSGLNPESVTVVMQQVPARPKAAVQSLVRLGPITTTASSSAALKTVVGALAFLNLLLVGCLLYVWSRLNKTPQRGDIPRSRKDSLAEAKL